MTATAQQPSALQKQAPERLSTHRASIGSNGPSGAPKPRKRPFGILPAKIARIERHIEALCALQDDEKLFARSAHILQILQRHEDDARTLYARRKIGFAYFDRTLTKASDLRFKLCNELLSRRRHLREQVIPECKNLAAQAGRTT